MFINQAYNYLHDSWRYLVGFIVIFIVWQLGSVPFLLAIMVKMMANGENVFALGDDQSKLMSVLDANTTLFFESS